MAEVISLPNSKSKVLSVEELFDSVGPAYEVAFGHQQPRLESIQWALDQIQNRLPAKVLDIGCGTGRPVCASFADAGHDVLGIDISRAMIDAARERVPNAKFEKVDMFDWQADDGKYDAITAYFSLICGVTQEQIRLQIKRTYDWLAPGGVFVLGTVSDECSDSVEQWMGRTFRGSCLSKQDLLDTIMDVGFEIVRQHETSFLPMAAVDAGICKQEDVWEENHIFVYAVKK